MIADTDLLEALPVAAYMTDADGRITFYNDGAAALWGQRPTLGVARWCGSWRLYRPDGRPMAPDETPLAMVLREGQALQGIEAVAERPDGTRVAFLAYPAPLRNSSGRVIGAIALLVDMAERRQMEIDSARLAAIVASSDDAIISKTLEGRITSWNAGASRIFGYAPEEMIGQPIRRIIPPELQHEEDEILAKLRRGERIDHYDTIRITKDGRRIDISLTVSPLRDRAGTIVGASKVARDITERKRSEELQRLLFAELNHRVKNMLATIQAIASQSLRHAASPADFVASFNGRLQALARAHNLLVQSRMRGTEMVAILREQVMPGGADSDRIACTGPPLGLAPQTAVQLALVLHELATNARKYGALSVPDGRLAITWALRAHDGRALHLEWRESGGPMPRAPAARGFGTTLIERSLETSGGSAQIRYGAEGVTCEIRLPLPEDRNETQDLRAAVGAHPLPSPEQPAPSLRGKRILLVEDEPLIAMEIEAELLSAGCEVIGPAGTLAGALRLVAESSCDAALLDANLGGQPVDTLATALTQRGIPFAFATGYGRDALPFAFREQAAVLTKPFGPDQLLATLRALLAEGAGAPG